jgi:hypothetical protein
LSRYVSPSLVDRKVAVFHFANDGAELLATNYFESEHAQRGYFFVSTNSRCFRVLLPEPLVASVLPEMQTGKSVDIVRTARGLVIWFNDGSQSPYRIEVSNEQCDRLPPASDVGRDDVTLAVWTEGPRKLLELPAKLVEK